MFVAFIWTTYTARVDGATDVVVCCERCGEQYSYRLKRVAVGRFRSPYSLHAPETGRKRAHERASTRLRRLLDREVEVVPCPSCGCYQNDMVRVMSRARLRWMFYVAGALVALAPITFATGMLYFKMRHMDADLLLPWTAAIGLLLLCAPACLLLRWLLNRRYDPNKVLRGHELTPGEAERPQEEMGG